MISDPFGLTPHQPTPEETADLFRTDDAGTRSSGPHVHFDRSEDLDLLTDLLTSSLARHKARIVEYDTAKKYQEALHVRGWVQGIDEALAYIRGIRGSRD